MGKEQAARKPKEIVGSQAFNLEYEKKEIHEAALREEIVSYLGEYRFELNKFHYNLEFSRGVDGRLGLRDDKKKQLMRDRTKRAVEERQLRGEPVHREEAEDAGIGRLDEHIGALQPGEKAQIFWASPSGPKDQGYGDYGFIFKGNVHKVSKDFATVSMTAIRVEEDKHHKSTEPYARALTLLTGKPINAQRPEELLSHPEMTQNVVEEKLVDKVVGAAFSGKLGKGKYEIFQKVIKEMDPMISQFIRYIKFGTKDERIQAFHALENYTLDLKRKYEEAEAENVVYFFDKKTITNLSDLMYLYKGIKPPEVAGSCGSTGKPKSNNPFNTYENLKKVLGKEDDDMFECPRCKGKFKPPVGDACPRDRGGCGLTKEQFVKEGGAVC